jgi:pentatricopeptide repeat protein
MLDSYTFNIKMRAFAVVNDIVEVERIIDEMKRDG